MRACFHCMPCTAAWAEALPRVKACPPHASHALLQIACQEHWSGWQNNSPHTLPSATSRGGKCSAVCTQAGTIQLMRETGRHLCCCPLPPLRRCVP
jgi:hypothetical protein